MSVVRIKSSIKFILNIVIEKTKKEAGNSPFFKKTSPLRSPTKKISYNVILCNNGFNVIKNFAYNIETILK